MLSSGESSVLQSRPAEELRDRRIIHQAAMKGDPLAVDVVRSVATLNHAAGILNLISLFDPELVLIGFAIAGLPAESRQRLETLGRMADLNIEEAVRRQMLARGLTPPTIRSATYGPDMFMQGAASLVVDDFLRTPPAAEV